MIEASRLAIDPLIGLPVLTGFTVIAALAWLAYAILGGKAWLGRAVARGIWVCVVQYRSCQLSPE